MTGNEESAGDGISFRGDENVLKLVVGMVVQLWVDQKPLSFALSMGELSDLHIVIKWFIKSRLRVGGRCR